MVVFRASVKSSVKNRNLNNVFINAIYPLIRFFNHIQIETLVNFLTIFSGVRYVPFNFNDMIAIWIVSINCTSNEILFYIAWLIEAIKNDLKNHLTSCKGRLENQNGIFTWSISNVHFTASEFFLSRNRSKAIYVHPFEPTQGSLSPYIWEANQVAKLLQPPSWCRKEHVKNFKNIMTRLMMLFQETTWFSRQLTKNLENLENGKNWYFTIKKWWYALHNCCFKVHFDDSKCFSLVLP